MITKVNHIEPKFFKSFNIHSKCIYILIKTVVNLTNLHVEMVFELSHSNMQLSPKR